MPELYLPKDDDDSFAPTQDDLDFAEAFELLAEAIDSSDRSELVLLRLSTCRNAYMTMNTLFVAIRKVLGHGLRPSAIRQCADSLISGDARRIRPLLDEMSGILKEFSKKVEVWESRVELDAEIDRLIKLQSSVAKTDRLRAVLFDVRTEFSGHGQVDSAYVSLSQAQPSYVAENIAYLIRVHERLLGIVEVLIAASELHLPKVKGPSLFDDDDEFQHVDDKHWSKICEKVKKHAAKLGIALDDSSGRFELLDASAKSCKFETSQCRIEEARRCLRCLGVLAVRTSASLYDDVSRRFRPNVARRQLPDLFKIDVTEPRPAESPCVTKPVVEVLPLGVGKPDVIRISVLAFGFPRSWYRDGSYMRFVDDRLEEVERALELAVRRAAEEKATALLLPEYSIPRRFEDSLRRLTIELKVGLIGGLEATTSSHGPNDVEQRTLNQAIVQLPNVSHPYYPEAFVQNKRTASVYESELVEGSTSFLFESSPLGNFGVILCSDYREMDILSAFADVGDLIDCLLVCSMNPHPRLFEQLAIADAHRFHAFVLVANNYCDTINNDNASSDGTVLCCPMAKHEDQVKTAEHAVALGIPPIGGNDAAIAFFDLPLGKLEHNGARPPKGFLPAPRCRRKA